MKFKKTDSGSYGLAKILERLLQTYTVDDEIVIKFRCNENEDYLKAFPDDEIEIDRDYLILKTMVDGHPDYDIVECDMFDSVKIIRLGGK